VASKFRDLLVWQKSHQFVLDIYKISDQFPQVEQYSITQQLRKAAYSIPANIAEGCCRGYTAEVSRFSAIAKGSLGEVEYFLILAKDLGYLSQEDYLLLEAQCNEIGRMLNGLINSLKR